MCWYVYVMSVFSMCECVLICVVYVMRGWCVVYVICVVMWEVCWGVCVGICCIRFCVVHTKCVLCVAYVLLRIVYMTGVGRWGCVSVGVCVLLYVVYVCCICGGVLCMACVLVYIIHVIGVGRWGCVAGVGVCALSCAVQWQEVGWSPCLPSLQIRLCVAAEVYPPVTT